ncbi:MAG TPA: fasciclin domain-containing protein [Marmoricola sp.]|nr:fasciclin domain-containing protein [Marmoricola sp.]
MKRTKLRSLGLAAAALTLTLSTAACGSDEESSGSSAPQAETSATEEPSEQAMTDEPFGAACDSVPADGAGSFQGMSTAPVATAASNNPVLSTLVKAVTAAELVDTLNSAPEITVFAPANPAFEAIPPKDLNALLADKPGLTKVLTHHVVEGKLSPEDVAGTHQTLNGDEVTVEGSGEDFTVGADGAKVICGNVQTANATVYIVDGVLMPQQM